jgi:DNA (cytosine-5)-methyltransferase 1
MGIDLGLAATGRFAHLSCVERDPACCKTIRINRDAGRVDPGRLYEADIETLNPRRVMADLGLRPGQLDVLVGGPPCQSYSTAGKQRGAGDVRGLMAWQYLWWVEVLRPRAFVMENVSGLLSARLGPQGDKGTLLARFLADVPADYRLNVITVNAVDHGVPQNRERVLVLGNRLGRVADMPPPTHGPGRAPYRTLADALAGLEDPEPVVARYTARRREVLEMVPPGGCWKDLPPEVAREAMGKGYYGSGGRPGWFRRLSWGRPSPTILTDAAQVMSCLCHPDVTRPLSVHECARVQTYPDGWEFVGTAADQYRAIGNAVPPLLGSVAGHAVADLLDGSSLTTAGLERIRFVDHAAATRVHRRKKARKASRAG